MGQDHRHMALGGNHMKYEQALSDAEIEARREAALKQMFATPHKPHSVKKRQRPSGVAKQG